MPCKTSDGKIYKCIGDLTIGPQGGIAGPPVTGELHNWSRVARNVIQGHVFHKQGTPNGDKIEITVARNLGDGRVETDSGSIYRLIGPEQSLQPSATDLRDWTRWDDNT